MWNLRITMAGVILGAAGAAMAGDPPYFSSLSWVGHFTDGHGQMLEGPNPPYATSYYEGCNPNGLGFNSLVQTTVENGAASLSIDSDLCYRFGGISLDRSVIQMQWRDIVFTGPYPEGMLFQVTMNFEYSYLRSTSTNGTGFADSTLSYLINSPCCNDLPATGGVVTGLISTTLNVRIGTTDIASISLYLELQQLLLDNDDSATGLVYFSLPTSGPVFNIPLPDVTVNSVQANIVDNIWFGLPNQFSADLTGPGGVPDGCVDAFDLGTLLGAWCSAAGDADPPGDVDPPCEDCTSPNALLADLSGPVDGAPDGCVDAFDLAKLLANWCSVAGGNPCGTCQ